MKRFKLVLGNFKCIMNDPSQIRFWIENEIGDYDEKAEKAEEWCNKAKIGDIYDDECIHIEVACTNNSSELLD